MTRSNQFLNYSTELLLTTSAGRELHRRQILYEKMRKGMPNVQIHSVDLNTRYYQKLTFVLQYELARFFIPDSKLSNNVTVYKFI